MVFQQRVRRRFALSIYHIDMRVPVFSHGQMYVAFSRVTRREDALVLVCEGSQHKHDGRILLLNKVCKVVLL